MPVAVDPKKWRELPQWTLEDLWLIESRGSLLPFELDYEPGEGGFVPEIPYALMLRFTKPGWTVYDPMSGMMTTRRVGDKIARDVISVDLVDRGPEDDPLFEELILADAQTYDPGPVDFVLYHPPYHNVIQFTRGDAEKDTDLSRMTWDNYWVAMGQCIRQFDKVLKPGCMAAVVIGDIYKNGVYVNLASQLYTNILTVFAIPWVLKGWIVKDIRGNRQGQDGLWLYRATNSDSFVFRKEHILVYQKPKE